MKSKIPPACLNQHLLFISKAQDMSCSPHVISERRQSYCLFVTGNTCLQQQLVKHTLNFWQSVKKRCREKAKKVSCKTFCVTCKRDKVSKANSVLTPFCPIFWFYNPWKHQKTKGFLVYSRSLELEHWSEIG